MSVVQATHNHKPAKAATIGQQQESLSVVLAFLLLLEAGLNAHLLQSAGCWLHLGVLDTLCSMFLWLGFRLRFMITVLSEKEIHSTGRTRAHPV